MTELTEAITDLANPSAFFPTARAMERRIVAHLGCERNLWVGHKGQGMRAAACVPYQMRHRRCFICLLRPPASGLTDYSHASGH